MKNMKTSIRLNGKLISMLNHVLGISKAELIDRTSLSSSTYHRIAQEPDIITIQQLLSISNGLHIPLSRFFSTGRADIIGKRDNLVADPFTPCRYDAETLQELVTNSTAANWSKAAETIGVTRSNLRNSLLAVTRTPVARFLMVCDVFEIEPFKILVDPNLTRPEESRRSSAMPTPSKNIREEIAQLQKQVNDLAATVEDLSVKYDKLLAAHNALARRVSVNIDTINNSHLSIVTEPNKDY